MKRPSLLLATLALLIGAGFASASPITYIQTVTGTGTLGSTSFTSALVTIVLTADTLNVTSPIPGVFAVDAVTATVTVGAHPTASFTGPFNAFVFENGAGSIAGFTEGTVSAPSTDILDTSNGGFAGYDLMSSIGPLSGIGIINTGTAFATNAGDFAFDSISGNVTYTATVSADTPEPAAISLMGLGLLGIAAISRSRR
jgi:hypothetical protein